MGFASSSLSSGREDSESPTAIVAIIGVGLIGGSIGLALRSQNLAFVVGVGRDQSRLDVALKMGAIDQATTDWSEGLGRADFVVVCTPTDRIASDVSRVAALAPLKAMITDVGSAKAEIVRAVAQDPVAGGRFLGAHPLAGLERQGVEHARADLLRDRFCVLTPPDLLRKSDVEREILPQVCLEKIQKFWQTLGCRTRIMAPEAHDQALAFVSHLPHVVAGALANTAPSRILELGAGSFRDGTRVAAADPELWAAIFLENRDCLLNALVDFENQLGLFRQALISRDRDQILSWWRLANEQRQRFLSESE